MGYQTVRALVPIRHSGVLRIPGQISGDNAQDFVAEDSQVARLVALGFVTSLGVAAAPADPTPGGPTAGSVVVQDEGAQVAAAAVRLNFRGAGVAASSDGAGGVHVDIPGSSATSRNNTRGLSRMYGAQSALTAGSGYGASTGWMGKWEAEAPFSRVRLWIWSRERLAQSRNWQFMVAPTETSKMDTVNNSFRPVVGGTVHNTWANAGKPWSYKGSDRYGWRKGTWGGSYKSGILMPGTRGFAWGGDQFPVSKPIVSDWIDCPSVAPVDGNGRPYMVFGISRQSAADESHSHYSAGSGGFLSTMSTEYKDFVDGKPWARLQLGAYTSALFDCTNDLTVAPIATNFLANNVGALPYIAWEFDYDVAAQSWWCVGDSQTEAKHGPAGGPYLLWWQMALMSRSTPSMPINAINMGMSSQHTASFRDNFFAALQSGGRPTHVLYPNYSVNNNVPQGGFTVNDLAIQRAELLEVIDVCKRLGIKLHIWTNPNVDPNGTNISGWEGSTAIAEHHAWTRRICAAGAATLVDIADGFDRSTMFIDGTHFNNLGDQFAADKLTAVL